MYATGFSSPSGCRWSRMAPSPYDDASTKSIVLNIGSYNARTGVVVNIRLTSPNTLSCASPHTHWFPLTLLDWEQTCSSGLQYPRYLRISPTLVGTGTLRIASTLLGSGLIPDSSNTCPKKGTCCWENLHFTLLSVRPSLL